MKYRAQEFIVQTALTDRATTLEKCYMITETRPSGKRIRNGHPIKVAFFPFRCPENSVIYDVFADSSVIGISYERRLNPEQTLEVFKSAKKNLASVKGSSEKLEQLLKIFPELAN